MLSLTENWQAQDFGRELVFSADLCYNGTNEKSSSGREPKVDNNISGMGVPDTGVVCNAVIQRRNWR